MLKNKVSAFFLMHFGFFVYSLYAVVGKLAAHFDFLSLNFCLAYIVVLFILAIYAFIWQKVLKDFPLTVASANKAVTILWEIIFGLIIFNENIKPNMILGAVIVLLGILFLNLSEKDENR